MGLLPYWVYFVVLAGAALLLMGCVWMVTEIVM